MVVGGGIYGAAAAWEAARRGLRTALIEAGDLGAATSANSLKVIHSGFRYLQNMDLARLRLSSGELSNLLGMAPHLVRACPCLVPTRGLGKQGRPAFAVALALYNRLISNRKLRGRLLERDQARAFLGPCPLEGVTGAALWYEGVVADAERLTLSYVLSAGEEGALAANYMRAERLLRDNGRISGVLARDETSGAELAVRARVVLLCAGAQNHALLGREAPRPALASAINLVLRPRLGEALLGLRSPLDARDDPVCGPHRFMFMVPWQDRTMLGTAYRVWPDAPRPAGPSPRGAVGPAGRVQPGLPGSEPGTGKDLGFYHWGLVPLASPGRAPAGGGTGHQAAHRGAGGTGHGERGQVHHRPGRGRRGGDPGLRPTGPEPGRAAGDPPVGRRAGPAELPEGLAPEATEHLRNQYGSRAAEVAALGTKDPALLEPLAPGHAGAGLRGCPRGGPGDGPSPERREPTPHHAGQGRAALGRGFERGGPDHGPTPGLGCRPPGRGDGPKPWRPTRCWRS